MKRLTPNQALSMGAVSGAVLWLAATIASGQREAWDSSLYWTMAYPAGVVIAGVLGFLCPDRAWRAALALMLAQAVVLAFMAASFGLLPLGLVLFAVLALPPMGVAILAARLRMHRKTR